VFTRTLNKSLFVCSLFLAACSTGEVVVTPPAAPAARVEVITPQPGPNYVWVPGYWAWDAGTATYVWQTGHWIVPQNPSAVWVPGQWVARSTGYVWVDGHWQVR
jgi:hypothetical protein